MNLLQFMSLSRLNRQRHCRTACYRLCRVSVTITWFEMAGWWLYCTSCWHLVNNGCPCPCVCTGFKRHSHQQTPLPPAAGCGECANAIASVHTGLADCWTASPPSHAQQQLRPPECHPHNAQQTVQLHDTALTA